MEDYPNKSRNIQIYFSDVLVTAIGVKCTVVTQRAREQCANTKNAKKIT